MKLNVLPDKDHRKGTSQRLATLDELDDQSVEAAVDRFLQRSGAPRIIMRFFPETGWLWRQWRGTVLEVTWRPAVYMMAVSAIFVVTMTVIEKVSWSLLAIPDPEHRIIRKLRPLENLWSYLLPMATFVNTFFLSQAYGFWLANKGNSRKVQGRVNDISMLLAAHAARDSAGRVTPQAQELLDTCARYIRLFHLTFWAAQVRPSRGDEGPSLSILRTPRGLAALLARGELTPSEHALFADKSFCAETLRHSVVLQWIVARFVDARRAGVVLGGSGMETVFFDKVCLLRATCASITDDAAARMPLSYVHLVQILVDTLIALAPFALYPRLGALTVPLCGVLTVFYRGFLVLSKSFLDPFGNEDTTSENLNVQCLVTETNAGSVRWKDNTKTLPFAVRATTTASLCHRLALCLRGV
ncbi:hypothetical protein AB1Y20_016015 [Prymnesium parvum]|uniref:Bestrophin homolog n=1 Tax=Prymnesium parvum TaxID=97485 RepID=A0AB34K056_PRYPA